MIAGVRGLVVLAAIALALALAAAAATYPTMGEPESRAVLPEFSGDATHMHWTRPRGPTVDVEKVGQGWVLREPEGESDQRAVQAVLASLRGARWHRRGERARAGTIHATLTLSGVAPLHAGMTPSEHTIELGDPIHGADQAWIVVDGTAMLVDGWVSRALDPDPLALRDRTPLADIRGAEAINVDGVGHHLVLARHPRRREVLVAPALADAFEHACEQLEIVRLPDGPLAFGDEVVTILEGEVVVQVGGVCPGDPRLVALRSRTGNGCVDPSTWHAVLAAEKVLEGPREQIVDTRPFGRTATTITLADGQLTLSKRPTIVIRSAIHAADPDRVAELVRALAEPATVAPMPAPFTPTEHYSIDDVEIDGAHDVLVRAGELVALHPSPAALAILRRPALTYVDTTRWIEEPSTITRIMVDDVLYRPGAVVGEWTREPAGHFDPALVSALAQTIAQLRAPARTGAVATLHKLSVTFAPPVGASSIHMLELGAPAADGCPALVDNVAITAPLALCTAAFAVAAR